MDSVIDDLRIRLLWRFSYGGSDRGRAENHYATMATDEICGLDVPAAGDSVLFLWVPNAMLPDGLRVLEAWGYRYVSNFVWVKDRAGLGFSATRRAAAAGQEGGVPASGGWVSFPERGIGAAGSAQRQAGGCI
jgi:hypothetical protein